VTTRAHDARNLGTGKTLMLMNRPQNGLHLAAKPAALERPITRTI
jgi:hypothetical protein